MILFNVIRIEIGCCEVFKVMNMFEECSLYKIVEVLCVEKYNFCVELNYFVIFFLNLM